VLRRYALIVRCSVALTYAEPKWSARLLDLGKINLADQGQDLVAFQNHR